MNFLTDLFLPCFRSLWIAAAASLVRELPGVTMPPRAYAEGLWQLMVERNQGFMTPRQCLDLDNQFWAD